MNQKIADRNKYIPWIFIPTVLAIVIQTTVAIVALEFYIVKGLGQVDGGTYTDFYAKVVREYSQGEGASIVLLAYAIVTAFIALVIFHSKFREGHFSSLKGKSKNLPLTVGGVLLFIVSMQYVTLYLLNSLASAFPSWLEEYQEMMDSVGVDTEMTVIMVLYAIFIGPICEELLFRGITFFAAKKVMPVYFAILVQAIMFAAFHMNKLQGAYALVIGLGLGYVMYLYDNLLIPIFVHVAYNFIGTLGSEFIPIPEGNSLITFFLATLASLIAVYASIILMRKGSAIVNNDKFFADI